MRVHVRRGVAFATACVLGLALVSGAADAGGPGPVLTTTASPNIMLGGQLTDTATVFQRAAGDERIDFRLYGPDDETCSGSPVFESLDLPYAGGS